MTTATTSLAQESRDQGAFYVPRFQVKIDGANLPRDVLYDVRTLTYEDSIDSIDSFRMEINNWDEVDRSFRYIGSETAAELKAGNPNYTRRTMFEPCGKDVEVQMGYGDRMVTMLRGNFTTMKPSFADTSAVLTVTGLNALHQLRRKQYTTSWTDKKDSEIAQDLSHRTDGGHRRFPMPIVIDDNAMQNEKPVPLVQQHNQYDIDFLFQRARVRGYVLFIQEADAATGRQRQLYFGPSRAGMIPGLRDVEFRLTWGQSLMEFKPKITTANQVRSVTVRGWHRSRKQLITRTVTLDDPRITVNEDLYRLLNACDPHEEIVVDEPIFTNCQARERAIAILRDQTKLIVTADDVKVVGLPDLRAGQVVVIDGVGARLSGEYFVTKTSHTIDDNGYVTTFSCRREQYKGKGSS
jgi:Bacteriophage probable baseplate hub protein